MLMHLVAATQVDSIAAHREAELAISQGTPEDVAHARLHTFWRRCLDFHPEEIVVRSVLRQLKVEVTS